MGDLVLKGTLNLQGSLKLTGKVKVGSDEALVFGASGDAPAPVPIPPPPAPPANTGVKAKVLVSFNQTVMAGSNAIVAMGMCFQGDPPIWPGIVLPSMKNATVTINHIPINVKGDQAIILPSGAPVSLSEAGQ